MKESPTAEQLSPCNCTNYNGGQCYNCLNGAHSICEQKAPCNKKAALTSKDVSEAIEWLRGIMDYGQHARPQRMAKLLLGELERRTDETAAEPAAWMREYVVHTCSDGRQERAVEFETERPSDAQGWTPLYSAEKTTGTTWPPCHVCESDATDGNGRLAHKDGCSVPRNER